MQFQTRITELLNERGLKQADLHRLTGIPRSLLSNYATGKASPALDNAILIAGALHVTLDELVGRKNETLSACETKEEEEILVKFRCLDNRGKRAVLRNLNAEYADVSRNFVEDLSSATGA